MRTHVCVCVCVQVYCRRVNTIIGCKLVLCARARELVYTYTTRGTDLHFVYYIKASLAQLSSLLFLYYYYFLSRHGGHARSSTHTSAVRRYNTPNSCNVSIEYYVQVTYVYTPVIVTRLYARQDDRSRRWRRNKLQRKYTS